MSAVQVRPLVELVQGPLAVDLKESSVAIR